MLGVSLRTVAEETCSDPRELGSQISNIFNYAKDIPVMFCRELKVPMASTRRLGRIGGARVCTTERAGIRMRRCRANHQSEVPGPAQHLAAHHWPTKSSALI
jgi:hypothetical protein